MGKITKTMQSKHRENLSPWVKDYVHTAASTPLPLIPRKLDEFPTRWPFPRGDLYHWIPLLNRFDSILEAFCATYKLQDGFQMRDFGCDLLLNQGAPVEYADEQPFSKERLMQLGYKEDGDRQLIVSILTFTRVLLQHCGNRSIYASSHHLNDLLNSTDLSVIYHTLEVGLELAQRYQASIKRVGTPNRQPFVKTPLSPGPRFSDLPPTTPGSAKDRQLALAVRLLAITNLAYIHPEATFVERVLKQDNDEPRRYQLVYQLAELVHPSTDGTPDTPLKLQAIALAALESITVMPTKYPEVVAALNANVNHGVLLYVIRKAVASMKDDSAEADDGKVTDADHWRASLFALTLQMAMASRIGQEMSSAGLLEIMVEILNIRSRTATRNYSMVLAFLDTIIYGFNGAFTVFSNAGGLDAISNLIIDTVARAQEEVAAGQGMKPEFHSHTVDYEIPFYHQQALKWLLKFIHHVMTNAFFGTNLDRLLRNLVDNSALLRSLRTITENVHMFGSLVWTNAAGRDSPAFTNESVNLERDERPHPPTQEMLEAPRERLAPGILASNDAISIIPSILNSISLNNLGLKMVDSSNVIETYLEIFESPSHVQVLSESDLANVVGGSFDELARHHPALRPAISNAILDMVARVLHLAKTKSTSAGWGAKLSVLDASGKAITADESLLESLEAVPTTAKGKEKAAAEDADVEMVDASAAPTQSQNSCVNSVAEDQKLSGPFHEITPSSFIRDGGIELLLQLSEAPSLPGDFESTNASRSLAHALATVIGTGQILGLPSLLNRAHAALNDLEPLNDEAEWDQAEPSKPPKEPTKEERASPRFQNYLLISRLLNTLTPSILPFFQTIGKVLSSKRGPDPYLRSHHLNIAQTLADTILKQFSLPQGQSLTTRDLRYWDVMFDALNQMLIDPTRQPDRTSVQLILPVLVAFKDRGGIELLNTLLRRFADELCNDVPECQDAQKLHLVTAGMRKILDIYHVIVNGRNVYESLNQTNLFQRPAERNRDRGHQLIVELRLAILPTARKLWESDFAEKAPTPALSRVIDIIKTIATADLETHAWCKTDKSSPVPLFGDRTSDRFDWRLHAERIKELTQMGYGEELAREAVYRANGKSDESADRKRLGMRR
ncbi:hypothetical protein VTH06DRAFT_1579 [Thermothelomyces fergusii]